MPSSHGNTSWLQHNQRRRSNSNRLFAEKGRCVIHAANPHNTVSRLVPMIMASKAYRDGGVIILWWDASEEDGMSNDNADDFSHTIGEIVISRWRTRT